MGARYVVEGGWAPGVAPALLPALPSSPTSSWWAWAGITGRPGTVPIPAGKPGVHSISPSVLNQPSWCSPDVIYPSQYWVTPDIAWRHTPVRPDEIMPVPAVNLFNQPGRAMRSRKIGGRAQVAQPPVVQQWPNLLSRLNAGSVLTGGGGPNALRRAAPLPPPGV